MTLNSHTILPASSEFSSDYFIGLGLALSSTFFIGASFVIKKKGLLRLGARGQTRAGVGGYGYLKEVIWWAGLLSMGIGELANFVAYAFAPASLVTPLGVLSVLFGTVFSSYFLGEKLNLLTKIGCFLSVIGSTVIVLHAPKERAVESIDQFSLLMFEPGFVCYVVIILTVSFIMIFYCVPKFGTTHVVVYVLICSMIGSLTVMECKVLGLAIRETISGTKNEFANWITWFCLFSLIACIIVQINYLNKALDTFNTSVITPMHYVFFTTFVIVASAVLFKEWGNMSFNDSVGSICGFLTVISGIFLLNAFRELDINLRNLSSLLRKKEDLNLIPDFKEDIETSVLHDCHRLGETSVLLERHSRQNSDKSFVIVKSISDNSSSVSYS